MDGAAIHQPTGRRHRADDMDRRGWIALAVDGPATGLGEAVRVIGRPRTFLARLETTGPRIAIVTEPPATQGVIDRVLVERRRRRRLRIVHLTDPSAVDARLRALRDGFDDALPASITPEELRGRLELLDERARLRGRGAVELGDDLELDLVAHELRRDGRRIHLRPKEYRLLSLLAAHPGRAYTRRQLLAGAWGIERTGDARTVDVHVRWLRSKLEDDPANPVHLVTVRGIGYRLDLPAR